MFNSDPFSYAVFGRYRWELLQNAAGLPVGFNNPPTNENVKAPALWLAQAVALEEAAQTLVRADPTFETMPWSTRGIADSQFRATALMLVGLSLEVALKASVIAREGVTGYQAVEANYQHHNLERLACDVPKLSDKDRAILRCLTHFVQWAGRYPDPGSKKVSRESEVFDAAEKHRVTAKDVFDLAIKIGDHVRVVIFEE